jgi:sugar/nucleoside kinase (ribokinase family)
LIRRNEEFIKVESLPVECRDTTGAGDLYASGFLYGYVKGLSLDKCGLLGSIMAGNVIEIIGARMDEEKWKDIKETVSLIVKS